jgi:hypothetical protein
MNESGKPTRHVELFPDLAALFPSFDPLFIQAEAVGKQCFADSLSVNEFCPSSCLQFCHVKDFAVALL